MQARDASDMFHVPTYLSESSIHGIGVYTPEPIPAGTVVWDYHPDVDWRLAPEELVDFPEPFRSELRRWCYLDAESGQYVLCGDNAKFMNHSTSPNCDDSGARTVAARDIAAGEELTCDYRIFDAESARDGLDFEASRSGAPAP